MGAFRVMVFGCSLVMTVWFSSRQSSAAEAPKKISAKASATAVRDVLMFPAPSELATGLKANGIKLAPLAKLSDQIPTPDWAKLPPRARQMQLGAVLGYLAFAAGTGDMPTVAKCLDQVMAGAVALGLPKTAKSYVAMTEMRDRIRKKDISDAKVMASLDELRRDALFDIANRITPTDVTCILGAAWLRGSSLLARQAKTDAEAAQLGEFVLRPELVDVIGKIPETAGGAPSPERRAAADKILVLAKKPKVSQKDLAEFSVLAESILKPQVIR